MNQTTTLLPRGKHDFVSTAELRSLLKSNLGLNARQATVSKSGSTTYLHITIRDPRVDIAAVKAFAAKFHTWTMDETDYCEGQSVRVETTREVDDAHAAPFLEEIRRVALKIAPQTVETLSNGKKLWRCGGEFYVTANDNRDRGCYIRDFDVTSDTDWAIRALALQAARVGNS